MGVSGAIIAGTAITAYGQYQGLRAQEVQAKHEARIERMNAEMLKQQIPDVIATGKRGARQIEQEGVRFSAEQLSAFASGNIDIASAVVGEAVEGTARTTAADILTLHHNVARDVWRLNVGVQSGLATAQLKEREARGAGRAAVIAPTATLLTGVGTLGVRRRSPVDVSGGTV
jgi:hypothetical protein